METKAKRDLSVLTLGGVPYYNNDPNTRSRKYAKPIYFNSNEYHGQRFISSDAVDAGYSNKMPEMDFSSVVDKGVGSIVVADVDSTLKAAEEVLLRSLICHYPDTRNAVRDVMQASSSVGPDVNIEWSSSVRKWLFECILQENLMESIDDAICDPRSLRALLASRDDVPFGAFKKVPSGTTHRNGASDAQGYGGSEEVATFSSDRLPPNNTATEFEGSLDAFFTPAQN